VLTASAELAGSGRPLDPADRAYFERFGTGLGHVRLHDDQRAAALAEAADAAAFTVGSHVFLDRGAAPLGSPDGRALLAHELAHVQQHTPRPHCGGLTPRPAAPRLDELSRAGIVVEQRTARGDSTEFVSRNLPSRRR
jgi:hypothetical protein